MSNIIDAIGFTLISLVDFEDNKLAHTVVKRLLQSSTVLQPKKFGIYDPIEESVNPLDISSIIDIWPGSTDKARENAEPREGVLCLECSSKAGYMINWEKSKMPCFSAIDGHVPIKLLTRDPSVLVEFFDLIKDLVMFIDATYGEIRNMSFKGWDHPFDLLRRLPDIPWTSIYGSPYILMFGKQRILSAPYYRIESIGSSHLWLQASESIFNPVTEEKKAAIRSHLGEDAFMSGGRWRYNNGKAPMFDFSRVMLS